MTLRGIRVLKEADLIAAEDTRTSRRLLDEFGITTPLTSYHKFNEESRGETLIARILSGETVALITDAGMPAISDPGEILVRKCMENHITVTAVPGPSACITALALSGSDTRSFVFEGFLPAENREKKEVLGRIRGERRTMVFYEAPHRLAKTLEALREVLGGKRGIVLARELTKRFEEVRRTSLEEAIAELAEKEARGEYVLVVDGMGDEEAASLREEEYREVDIPSHVAGYEAAGMTRKEAMKACARDRGISRREVYAALLEREG
jgi:16S rRNA (cytidine1402-2'-O)-methyltransferase